MNDIANQLDAAMRAQNVDQPWLAKASGVSQATISRTLKGITVPETNTLRKLYAALGLNTSTIESPQQNLIAIHQKPKHARKLVQTLCDLAEQISDDGLRELAGFARCLTGTHPLIKKPATRKGKAA